MHELIATAAVLVLLFAYSQIYIFIAGLGGVVQAPLKSNPPPLPSAPLLLLLVRSATRNGVERLDSLFVVLSPSPSPLPPFFFFSLSLRFCFCFFCSSSHSFSVLVRCFAAHGFSRAACNSSGDLLRLIELWETRDANARRTSERDS